MAGIRWRVYGELNKNLYTLIKGLGYFADATDDMPKMLMPVDWEEVKEFFIKETKRLASEKLKL